MSQEMIKSTPDAKVSRPFRINGETAGSRLGSEVAESSIFAVGLVGGETVTIKVIGNDGQTADLVIEGVTQTLSASQTSVVVRGALPIVVEKTATSKAVGVYLSTPLNV